MPTMHIRVYASRGMVWGPGSNNSVPRVRINTPMHVVIRGHGRWDSKDYTILDCKLKKLFQIRESVYQYVYTDPRVCRDPERLTRHLHDHAHGWVAYPTL